MKKFLLPLIAIAFTTNFASAQISLASTDFAEVGDNIEMFINNDSASVIGLNVQVGNPGGPQAWDFSTWTKNGQDTLIFATPNGTFTGANLMYTLNETTLHLNKSTNDIKVVGTELNFGGMPLQVPFNPPYTFAAFPSTMGTNFTGNYVFDQKLYVGVDTSITLIGPPIVVKLDSIRIVRYTSVSVDFDAYGTLKLASNGTRDALRSKNVTTNNDTTFIYMGQAVNVPLIGINLNQGWNLVTAQLAATLATFGFPIGSGPGVTTTTSYDFFEKFMKFRVASVAMRSNNTPSRVEWINNFQGIGVEESAEVPNLGIYPNPATDFIVIDAAENKNVSLRFINMEGKVAVINNVNGKQNIDISALAAGTYQVQLINHKGTIIGKDKIVKL